MLRDFARFAFARLFAANFLLMQMGDVLKTYADISKAKKILNYNPKFPIEKGLEEYIKTT